MNHQLVGLPVLKFESASLAVDDNPVQEFGPGAFWDSRMTKIVDAIRAGEIEGDIYSDGEVWADPQSLRGFIARQLPA